MAVVDSLLSLAESQGARALVIVCDQPPELVLVDGPRLLSMPAIPAATVADFAREVGGESTRYETSAGQVFDVLVEGEGVSLRLTFSQMGGAAPPEPAALEAPAPPARPREVAVARATSGPDARLLALLGRMEGEDASDLLLSSGLPPRMRAGGVLRELDGPILDERGIRELLAPALNESAEAQLRERGSVDLALALPGGPDSLRFRANLFRQQRGLAVALRPIRLRPPSLSELNLPDDLYELVGYPNGLVLVTGPSGSGKSTTLVALTEHLNRRASRHIVTLEDPIEYEYTPQRSLIHQRELGRHVESFSGGLVAALREAPDVILVGEMRDRETIAAALTAADTGHLVLSTLHSANPWMAIDRIVDVFAAEQQREVRTQLAAVLRAVLSQHLLVSTTPPLRVPAYEKLVMTVAAANQIRDDKAHQLQSTIQTGRDDGMVPLEASLAELVRTGRLERGRARGLARDVRMFEELVR
jgi:twitching motility protein PilT